MVYDELATGVSDAPTEAFKCAASLGVVDGLRGKEVKVMKLAKFGTYDYIYSTFIEGDKKIFGFDFPKLSSVLGEDPKKGGTDRGILQTTYLINKWLYVVALSWTLKQVGMVGGFSRAQTYDYALAYALRAGVGFAMESPA